MQKQFLLFIFIAFLFFIKTEKCFSQIEIQNPSFEGPNSITPPPQWDTCRNTPDTAPNSVLPETYNLIASDGLTYCGMYVESHPAINWESTGQKLSCPLRKNQIHKMSLDLAFVRFNWFGFIPGQMGLYGDLNRCDSTELLWLSPVVDSVWTTFNIQFIPHENYDFISFWPYVQGYGNVSYIAIDNLSPTITVLNGGLVAA